MSGVRVVAGERRLLDRLEAEGDGWRVAQLSGTRGGGDALDEAPELRIALAMRGGVSLAVWMGGACSEIDALRRAVPTDLEPARPLETGGAVPPTAAVYARLLEACGYSGVVVDVVAGASAGGLNGVLMGCGVVHGMPLGSQVRDLWLELGDIGALVRGRALQAAPSVLDGDGKFYAPLFEKMNDLLEGVAPPPLGSGRFDLTLTGTLFHPRPSKRYQDLGDVIVEPRHHARFRFRHLPGPDESLLCDFGREAGTRAAALQRLAYAARTTSSFPGAFEPALVGCTEGPAAGPQPGSGPASPPASLYGVYSESREPGDRDVARDLVIDGGVLDNIPVAWAVRSIAAAPAHTSVHRWLVYLQPVPFRELSDPDERRPDLRGTVKHARKLRSGTETLTEDIDELERLRRSALSREGFRMVVEYALGEKRGAHARDDGSLVSAETDAEFLRGLFSRALAATGAYRQRLGVVEASRLRQLLADPLPVLGADPLGYAQFRWVNRPDGASAQLLERLPAGASLADAVLPANAVLERDAAAELTLEEQTAALIDVGRGIRTPQALARTVAALLDSARDLGADGQELKGQLYDERTRIELLIAWHDRYLAAEPFKPDLQDAEPIELARRAAQRLAGPPPYELGDEAAVAGGWPAEPFAERWDELVSLAGVLAGAAQPPQRAVLSCLMSAASGGTDQDQRLEAVLVATELLTGPSRPDPLAETTHIRFHMLSARNVSGLVEGLRREAKRPLTVDEKLAGNQLANFGAFLRTRWRQNDWIWGRLDAARSLVDILTAPDPDAPSGTGAGGDGAGRVDWTALATLAGVSSDTAREEVTDALVTLLHERILREELPVLRILGSGPPSPEQLGGIELLAGEVDEKAVLPLLRTGQETVASALVKDPLRLGIALRLLDLGALGWTSGSARAAAHGISAGVSRGGKGLADRMVRASKTLRRALGR
jgi:patatin-related protein